MRWEVVPEQNMKESENAGVDETVACVAVDEAVIHELLNRVTY